MQTFSPPVSIPFLWVWELSRCKAQFFSARFVVLEPVGSGACAGSKSFALKGWPHTSAAAAAFSLLGVWVLATYFASESLHAHSTFLVAFGIHASFRRLRLHSFPSGGHTSAAAIAASFLLLG